MLATEGGSVSFDRWGPGRSLNVSLSPKQQWSAHSRAAAGEWAHCPAYHWYLSLLSTQWAGHQVERTTVGLSLASIAFLREDHLHVGDINTNPLSSWPTCSRAPNFQVWMVLRCPHHPHGSFVIERPWQQTWRCDAPHRDCVPKGHFLCLLQISHMFQIFSNESFFPSSIRQKNELFFIFVKTKAECFLDEVSCATQLSYCCFIYFWIAC